MKPLRSTRGFWWEQAKRQKKTRQSGPIASNIKDAARQGGRAARRGEPRYSNPLIGTLARAWAYGWNKGHGECSGDDCEQCLVGTAPMAETLDQYLRRVDREGRE